MEEELTALAPRLLRYCLGRTGSREQAEEVCQESLAALIHRWRRHGPPDSPLAFAFAVARRRAARSALKRRLLEPFTARTNGGPPASGPQESAESRDRLQKTLAAIRGLPGRDREALLVVAAAEVPLREGAELLGVSVPALKMRLHRARRRLQAELGEDHE